ncbi:MAG: DUF1987 domain-containing protein [Cyclobacteriaceae bacterium]
MISQSPQPSGQMIDVLIAPTSVTPYVKIDSEESKIIFCGKSSPPNSIHFYYPIIEKIKKLFADVEETIVVDFSFRYFNTSSSKCLFDLFKMLKGMEKEGKELEINWHYEEDDDDMLETGEDYADILDLEFNYIEVDEIDDIMVSKAV